jgi:uncharacterized protein (TIGR02145 family)
MWNTYILHGLFSLILLAFTPSLIAQQTSGARLIDIDGNVYHSITIGKQVWMQENLRVTRYSNGDTIETSLPDTLDLSGISAPKYQWPPMRDEQQVQVYGRLYTWYVVADERKVCPSGWHVPTDEEFCTLENYIEPGADLNCDKSGHRGVNTGNMLKEAGLAHWTPPSTGADNRSRFNGLPAGIRYLSGDFTFLGSYGYFWAITDYDSTRAWSRRLYHDQKDVSRAYYFKKDGFSIRCLKD